MAFSPTPLPCEFIRMKKVNKTLNQWHVQQTYEVKMEELIAYGSHRLARAGGA